MHGPGVIHTVDKVIDTVDDLKGLKMRGPTRQVTKLLASLGATPVGMPLPGIPDALSKGTIQGAVIPWEVVPSVKVHELTKFHAEFDPAGGALYTTTFVTNIFGISGSHITRNQVTEGRIFSFQIVISVFLFDFIYLD